MMNIAKEELTFDGNGIHSYTVQVRNFHQKMKNWAAGERIDTKEFKVQDLDLSLRIYPNGQNDEHKGNVSVFLMNSSPSKQLYVHYTFQIGDQEKEDFEKGCLDPNMGRGSPKFCNHVSTFPAYKPDENLQITCKIWKLTTDKVVWNLYHDSKTKLALIETKLEEMQYHLNNNNNVKKPPCPVCFDEMSYNTKIAQCLNGHHVCWSCKEKMLKNDCPSCGLPVDGRAFGMESYLRSLFGLQ